MQGRLSTLTEGVRALGNERANTQVHGLAPGGARNTARSDCQVAGASSGMMLCAAQSVYAVAGHLCISLQQSQGDSGWCPDETSTLGVQ